MNVILVVDHLISMVNIKLSFLIKSYNKFRSGFSTRTVKLFDRDNIYDVKCALVKYSKILFYVLMHYRYGTVTINT